MTPVGITSGETADVEDLFESPIVTKIIRISHILRVNHTEMAIVCEKI